MHNNVIVGIVGIALVLWTLIGYYRSVFYYTTFNSPPPVRNKFYFQKQNDNGISSRLITTNQRIKYILYYTKFFESEDWYIGYGQKPFLDANCPINTCYLTANKSLLGSASKFDAILFHIRNLSEDIKYSNNVWNELLKNRHSNQRYVMFTLESPENDDFPYHQFDDFFNWTMTYRLDSDFPQPYGWIGSVDDNQFAPPTHEDFEDMKFPNTKLKHQLKERKTSYKNIELNHEASVAWMVSNCYTASHRERYVLELQKHISVDVYGSCENVVKNKSQLLSCPKQLDQKCWDQIDQNYKFYLSFENSICDDYITEKFWKVMERKNAVPVVLGGADYSRVAPQNSYIDARQYSSPEDLAHFLIYLDQNESERLKYLNWKNAFRATPTSNKNVQLKKICDLCKALNSPLVEWPIKSYPHIQDWWRGTSDNRHCDSPKDVYSNGLSALTRHLGISPSLEKRIEKFYGVAFVITILFVILCFVGTMFKAC